MRSNMTHDFSKVPSATIQRSSFNRSASLKTTFDSGYLVPVYFDEALPGDTFNLNMTSFARLLTPVVPFMDNLFLDTFFFFVPNRLIWDNWEKFNGAQKNPGDSVDFLVPQVPAPVGGFATGSLFDYLGIPVGVANFSVNALHSRAYNLIYNEWFRSENLQNSVVVDTDDGPDSDTDYVLLRRGKRHDYFTSALPWPQKGTAVSIGLTGTAPVRGDGTALGLWDGTNGFGAARGASGASFQPTQGSLNQAVGGVAVGSAVMGNNIIFGVTTTAADSGMVADLSGVSAVTINNLRQAFQLQKMLERDARGGTRYTEILQAHFGVKSPDSRLQRPEYLGGSSTPIHVHPVAQTSSTDATTPQGNLSAYATAVDHRAGFTKSFVEHGVILGLVNVRADLSYQQGLDRMYSRRTRLDYYWPAFSHLGEQAILNKEIYIQGTSADNDPFGYQERYGEYRYKNSYITGKFRSQAAGNLDVWHLAQNFGSLPALNSTFIVDNPPVSRVVAVQSEPQFFIDCFFNSKCARPMPVYGVPGLIDHF